MANLLEQAELAYRQCFPNPTSQTPTKREEFIQSAKAEYAYQMWRIALEQKAAEGFYEIPSHLLTTVEVEIENNEADLSDLNVLRDLPQDLWLQNVGGINCKECTYIKSSFNNSQLLCDDDSIGDDAKTYYPFGKKLIFPRGVHRKKLPITYANDGSGLDARKIEIQGSVGKLVRDYLVDTYLGKRGVVDKTTNNNPSV